LGNLWRPLGDTRSWSANFLASVILVGAWGWFLYQGVIDPLGGINTLWPLFGLANQLLSVIALCLATTLLIKMQKTRYIMVTLLPLFFMCAVTFSAGYLKIFSPNPKLGFLSGSRSLIEKASGLDTVKAAEFVQQAAVWRIDAFVAGAFLLLVLLILLGSALQWWQLVRGTRVAVLCESEFVPLSREMAG
jgi:carbon starvation protein